ncbi:MAG: PD-(D/E)XK nuclease family protein [Butyrivibrio sp.]|uniref:PD-(D/E)XK nuclease family protein n=1 Tax=Butyrivibrio sp. TaxID=28121 RepID=UPI0025DBF6D2|nr:PD-(D/E)XK nuclease family protein [Butyrivibrio sp.]MCR5772220.1 PD-(D/E)XK nuclease family protein [Butyrivibrio sp.]
MLRFVFGASGSGKSYYLRQEMIERSVREPDRNFLIVVPDQFTMQTQLDTVKQHPRNGIMNIDVLSFSRLSHRIFEEVGESREKVLDDMGKSLVLRHVAETMSDELTVIGANMHKMGYIDEVKSTISEFMQYRIEPEDLDRLLEVSSGKGVLRAKLQDLQTLYKGFKTYISDKFIAQEETMDILCRALPKSRLIPGSVIVFDGFTGFTPIQYQVIGELLSLADEVIFSFSLGEGDNPYIYDKSAEQELFLLSKKTVHDILRLEYENEKNQNPGLVPDFNTWAEYRNGHSGDVFIQKSDSSRHSANPELSFLEQHLFRYGNASYEGMVRKITFMDAIDVKGEVRMVLSKLKELIREHAELHYRDFAIVCGSLERYGDVIADAAEEFDIPIYLDQTGNIKLNPFIEFIRSALLTVSTGYSYDSLFHFLRSGIPDFKDEETDSLENYVRALGIRGRKNWENEFTKIPGTVRKRLEKIEEGEKLAAEYLEQINGYRKRVQALLEPLFNAEGREVRALSEAVYEMITVNDTRSKLSDYEQLFHEAGDEIRAKEYAVIYDKVMEVLSQITTLMGDEKLSVSEYLDILEVGFGDIEIGTIPQSVDRVVVGDIERTRLNEVRNLFFLGVNDDLIPKGTGTGGIISDIERQFLIDSATDIEMAPTPRQQMYIQRLYLYMNLTKPSQNLYLTYSHLTPDGSSIRPAYIICKISTLFPGVQTISAEKTGIHQLLQTSDVALSYVSENIRRYSEGYMDEDTAEDFKALYRALLEQGEDKRNSLKRMLEAAGMNYSAKPLTEAVATMLYGNVLVNSVSRLEKFAQCAYAHFLRYGLGLKEREEFSFEASDLGNVFHGVLETFSHNLEKENLTWTTFSKEQGERILDESFDSFVNEYESNILSESSRNLSARNRIRRILGKSVDTLQYQLQKGSFMPKYMETGFDEVGDIDAINVNLTEDERGRILKKMKLTGRIDRMDTCEDADHVYIKVIDFKSGDKKFDLCALYYGLQLQLVMYMNVARDMEKKSSRGKDIIPAALLYYHLSDPVLEGESLPEDANADIVNEMVRKSLRPRGVILEDKAVVDLLDHELGSESDVIKVKINKGGDFSKSGSDVMPADDFDEVSKYVNKLVKQNGRRIVDGDIEVNPYAMGDRSACDYCSFRSICGFDDSVPGYCKRELKKLDNDEIMENIRALDD